MTLALLDSIREKNDIDLDDIMGKFVAWYEKGSYTPFGEPFDMGNTCSLAIESYEAGADVSRCGGTGEHSNGNGSLMRIMPVCLYCYEKQKVGMTDEEAIGLIHAVGGLTHNHLRSRIACGLYYFTVRSILDGTDSLMDRIHAGLNAGFAFYDRWVENKVELAHYGRLRDLSVFSSVQEDEIRSSGYVVDTLEAAAAYRGKKICVLNFSSASHARTGVNSRRSNMRSIAQMRKRRIIMSSGRRSSIMDLCYNGAVGFDSMR